MITEIEKAFFDTFGIERKRNHEVTLEAISGGIKSANLSQKPLYEYPQITDRILLELICIHNTYLEANLYSLDYESLKKEVLKDLIDEQELRELKNDYVSDDMKQQVRTLFDEVENSRDKNINRCIENFKYNK